LLSSTIGQDQFGSRQRPTAGIADESSYASGRWKTFWSDGSRLVCRAAKWTPAELIRRLLKLQREHAVHKHVLDSHTGLVWIGKGRFIDDRLGIEDRDIGEVVLAQQSAVVEALALRRKGTEFTDC